MNKAIFLDKDGTLIPDIPYNANPKLITLQDEMLVGLQELQSSGYKLIVISNQAGIAHGHFNEEDLNEVKKHLCELLGKHQLHLSGFYFCPHHPNGKVTEFAKACNCRKPNPGLFYQAACDNNIDLAMSWMIGDILNDVEAGNRAGCRTILIDNGNETEWINGPFRTPTYTTPNINQAANYILNSSKYELAEL